MKKSIILFICIIAAHVAVGQGVSIGSTTPDASAKLDVSSTTQGMLVPRMTTAQRTAISNPASGLLVFDLTTNSFWFKASTSWVQLVDSIHTEVHRNGADKIYLGLTDNVGIGITTPTNKLDIATGPARSGIHPTGRPLYVTGNIGQWSNGFEFGHPSGQQGIGIGYQALYASGSDANGGIGLAAKGPSGQVYFLTNGITRMNISGSGNVGIGPGIISHAPLQFQTIEANRKIVLYEPEVDFQGVNNDHQFFGFGVNQNFLRYQSNGDHAFFSGINATTSKELVRMTSAGNVGIGTTSPNAPLQFTSVEANRKIVLYEGGNNEHQYFGFGINASALRYQAIGDHVFYAGVNSTTSNELMRIKFGGNVGIGNNDPHAPLQFSNSFQNRKMVLFEVANDNHQFFGLGTSGGILRYQVGTTSDKHIFYAGSGGSSSNELMRIVGNGQVGIGVTNPAAMLEIARGTAPNGSVQINGTTYASHFSYGVSEDTYIRGGIAGSKVIINDYGDFGNVGIGTATPLQKLHVGGNVAVDGNVGIGLAITLQNRLDIIQSGSNRTGSHATGRALYVTGDIDESNNGVEFRHSNGTQGIGFGYNTIYATGSDAAQNLGIKAKGTTGNVILSTNETERMRVTGGGSVGIGNTDPHAPLQFANVEANRKIVLYEGGNNDHQYFGFGINASALRYQALGDHVFYTGNVDATSTENMRIKENGNVDITGKLEIGYVRLASDYVNVNTWETGYASCTCPTGSVAIGGGYDTNNNVAHVIDNYPSANDTWLVGVYNSDIGPAVTFRAFVICARLAN